MIIDKSIGFVFQDWQANRGNTKGQFVLLLYRSACLCDEAQLWLKFPAVLYLIFYRAFVSWILGIELPLGRRIGSGLVLYHGQALVIHPQSRIGKNCVLRHSTTIGNRRNDVYDGFVTIGDSVEVGANSVILGPISIGDFACIGAGSVVVEDVPPYATVVGNPAKVIRISLPVKEQI